MRCPWLGRHSFDNLYAVRFELADLVGIVREQADAAHSQRSQDSGGEAVIPRIGGESQVFIRFYSIHASILQFVCAQFVHQADTTRLLTKIKKKTNSRGGHLLPRQLPFSA